MVSTSDISVVVQGPINEFTRRTLQSVREILPGAELILSTWKESDLKNLDYDTLKLNDDPGGYEFCLDCGQLYNVNRLIVSTREGVKIAKRRYVLKLRSDMELHSNDFINYFHSFPTKTKYTFLNKKILIGNIYTRNPHHSYDKMLFHIGDFFYFGLKEDILTIFDIELASQNVALYFRDHKFNPKENTKIFCKYFPEQYIWISFIQKFHPINIEHRFDSNKYLIDLHDKILVSNCILIDLKKSGIDCLKYPINKIKDKDLISQNDYIYLYNKICNEKIDLESFIYFATKKVFYYMKLFYMVIKYPERRIRHYIRGKLNRTTKKI
ncbi:MAG: WavE lipopolysaccharide synthesis family protein [Sulfuricurvum sp.]|uniref:WavE lipopolysaccharide synthesis family protein n=1 Tax=Sulfuricurvum sp. TaxID=2025608 RepID=UPI002635B402|nr:WavE lipopolysaccharide synthesis family protein [Sulfuricurvum sp.]MDD2367945.1 WavE lipopolysaccharide synthesis family protein [Sulfuricurvum sp.]